MGLLFPHASSAPGFQVLVHLFSVLDPEHIFPTPSSVFAQSAPGGSPEFSALLQAMQEDGLSSPALHPWRCSNSLHPLLPDLLVSFTQEPVQGGTLSGS